MVVNLTRLFLFFNVLAGKLAVGTSINSCFQSDRRTNGYVIKEVKFTGRSNCVNLCLSYTACKGVAVSPTHWVSTSCYIVAAQTSFFESGWQYANRSCFEDSRNAEAKELTISKAEMKNSWRIYPPGNLIDGNLQNFAHSYAEKDGMWVRVRLKKNSMMRKVIVYNRHNCCRERIIGASVLIKSGVKLITDCGKISTANFSYTFYCEGDGNVIEVHQDGKVGEWNIAEIRVYGTSITEPKPGLSTGGIVGTVVGVLAGLVLIACLIHSYRTYWHKRSARRNERQQFNQSAVIQQNPNTRAPVSGTGAVTSTAASVPPLVDNGRNRAVIENTGHVTALGAGNLSPPLYREAVGGPGGDKVPSYEEVMANENKYDTTH